MSETVHYRGVIREITPTDKTLQEVAKEMCEERGIEIDDYILNYKKGDWAYLLADNEYEKYVYLNERLFEIIENEELDPYNDIARTHKLDNGDISFELKYYNGGAGFTEVLEEALNNLK